MKIEFEVEKAIVFTPFMGADLISLHVKNPAPFPEGAGEPNLILDFSAQRETGYKYLVEILKIKKELIKTIKAD